MQAPTQTQEPVPTIQPEVHQAQAGPEVDMQDVQNKPPSPSHTREQEGNQEEQKPSTPTTTTSKQDVKGQGTPVDPIPIEETKEEKAAAAAERAKLMPTLRKSHAVAKVQRFPPQEKKKRRKPWRIQLKGAEKRDDIAAISSAIQPQLSLEEQMPMIATQYEAGTSSQAKRQEEESNEGDHRIVSIDESLQIMAEHMHNIQLQSSIDMEEKGLAQLQALQMATINDKLKEKLQGYQVELALEKSKVDAEYERSKSLI